MTDFETRISKLRIINIVQERDITSRYNDDKTQIIELIPGPITQYIDVGICKDSIVRIDLTEKQFDSLHDLIYSIDK